MKYLGHFIFKSYSETFNFDTLTRNQIPNSFFTSNSLIFYIHHVFYTFKQSIIFSTFMFFFEWFLLVLKNVWIFWPQLLQPWGSRIAIYSLKNTFDVLDNPYSHFQTCWDFRSRLGPKSEMGSKNWKSVNECVGFKNPYFLNGKNQKVRCKKTVESWWRVSDSKLNVSDELKIQWPW